MTPAPVTALRIGLVVDEFDLAGTELQFAGLAVEFARAGHRVHVLSLRPVPARAAGVVADLRAAGVAVSTGPGWAPGQLHRLVPLALRWVREQRPHVVHAAMSRGMVLFAALRGRPGMPPFIASRRSLVSVLTESPVTTATRRWAGRRADLIIANAGAVARDSASHERIPPSRYRVIPNGIPPAAFRQVTPAPLPRDLPLAVTIANLRAPKGHRTLLRAAATIPAPMRFVFVGDGPLRGTLEQQARGCGHDVRFVGSQPDVRPFLAAADVVVSPSDAEGCPNAVLEAMAAGCAIVATDVGGTAEVLGDAGVLVPPGDPAALAAGMADALSAAPRLTAAARDRALDFTMAKCAGRYLAAYGAVIEH